MKIVAIDEKCPECHEDMFGILGEFFTGILAACKCGYIGHRPDATENKSETAQLVRR